MEKPFLNEETENGCKLLVADNLQLVSLSSLLSLTLGCISTALKYGGDGRSFHNDSK
jgi:hypothetical protein